MSVVVARAEGLDADFTKGTGSGGESIYGGSFEDEDLETPLDKAGLVVWGCLWESS